MQKMKSINVTEAKQEIKELSLSNPGYYITAFACFGLFWSKSKHLNVFAPSDSYFPWYGLNGKIKSFSDKQVIADQNATPAMF